MKLTGMVILTFILSLLFADSPSSVVWHTDIDEAMAVSEREKKPLVLYFSGSDWCKPCILWTREAFESAEFETYATENLILLKADFPRNRKNRLSEELQAHNNRLAEKYNPDGNFPYLVLLSPDGQVMGKTGYTKGGFTALQQFIETSGG